MMDRLNPFRAALICITGHDPIGINLTGCFCTKDMREEDVVRLQEWCVNHSRASWHTGIGIIEAAEALVAASVETGTLRI